MSTSPTVRRRRLGAELRRLREAAGLTGEEVVKRLGWYYAKVSKVEKGRIAVHHGDVRDLLDLYEVTDPETRDRLIALAREAKRREGWWQPYGDLLSRNYATYIDLESAASSLRTFEPLLIPGLLQTEEYARCTIQRGGPLQLDEEEVERRVELRIRRQRVFESERTLNLWVVLDEAALRRRAGGRQVMRDQLRRLAEEAHKPQVMLQVVPYSRGVHAAMSGAFGIFSFPAEDDHDIAYSDVVGGILYLERPGEVETATSTFNHLIAAALSKDDSVALINDLAHDRE